MNFPIRGFENSAVCINMTLEEAYLGLDNPQS
jgi:hypothetical protein